MDQPRGGPRGIRLPDITKRTILMLKESNPEWGCRRISDMLLRGPAYPASPSAVAKVLWEAGYELAIMVQGVNALVETSEHDLQITVHIKVAQSRS